MVRLARAEVFDPNEVAIAHIYNRTVRRCFLMGDDAVSGKNFDPPRINFDIGPSQKALLL
jgi:hypothetical protein